MNKWVMGLFIIMFLVLLGVVIAYSEINSITIPAIPNVSFNNNSNSCVISSNVYKSMGFALYYTTKVNGKIFLTIDFMVTYPSTAFSGSYTTFNIIYNSGTAPICGTSASGINIGNSYKLLISSTSVAGITSKISDSVGINLSINTTYWFDISANVISSFSETWNYSNPQMSVIES